MFRVKKDIQAVKLKNPVLLVVTYVNVSLFFTVVYLIYVAKKKENRFREVKIVSVLKERLLNGQIGPRTASHQLTGLTYTRTSSVYT